MLSILTPGIRPQNWPRLLASVESSFSQKFEIIFVGPTPNLELLKDRRCTFIQSYRSPSACQQIALIHSVGDYVTWAADDGWFLPNMLDAAFHEMHQNGNWSAITCQYKEGPGYNMETEDYYKIWNAPAMRAKYIHPNWVFYNVAIINSSILKDCLGGWDCQFQSTSVSHADLAVRLQRSVMGRKSFHKQIFECTHMPGESGDHGPIHNCQTLEDEPLFRQIHNTDPFREKIDLYNCFQQPSIWKKRFNG